MAILERRKNVAARYVRGQTQWEIARAFEVDQGTVSRDLAAIRAEWLTSSLQDFDVRKAEELAKIDAVEAQAWSAWSKSQENAEILRERFKGEGSEKEKTIKGQAGDAKFLAVVLDCIEKRCKICGLIVTKVRHGGDEDAPPIQYEQRHTVEQLRGLPIDERLRIVRAAIAAPPGDPAAGPPRS